MYKTKKTAVDVKHSKSASYIFEMLWEEPSVILVVIYLIDIIFLLGHLHQQLYLSMLDLYYTSKVWFRSIASIGYVTIKL